MAKWYDLEVQKTNEKFNKTIESLKKTNDEEKEKLIEAQKKKKPGYFFYLALPHVFLILANIVLVIVYFATKEQYFAKVSEEMQEQYFWGLAAAINMGAITIVLVYDFIAAKLYMKMEGIEDSTYETGRIYYVSTYDADSNTVTTESRNETAGGGEYFWTLLGIWFVGIIFCIKKIKESKKKLCKELDNIDKEYLEKEKRYQTKLKEELNRLDYWHKPERRRPKESPKSTIWDSWIE